MRPPNPTPPLEIKYFSFRGGAKFHVNQKYFMPVGNLILGKFHFALHVNGLIVYSNKSHLKIQKNVTVFTKIDLGSFEIKRFLE